MHLKKTKKNPRTIRIIALMLSLVLVFFTMTGMALAEEGTDVTDAAPDSTLEIVEAELEADSEPTKEPPAETPGAEETPEPTPEPEEPSIPPETTDAPALEPDYELDAEIPTGWHNAPVTITVRLIDKNNTGWVKIEVAFSDEDDAERFDATEEWNEYGYWERTMPDNGTVYFFVTDPLGVEHELPLDVYCMDFEAPVLRAGINGTLLRVEARDALSGIAAVFVNDELYTTLDNGVLNIHIGGMTEDKYMYVQALDNAGNRTDYLVLANPCYEKPTPAPTPTPSPTPSTDENKKHDAHCPAGCDCRKTALPAAALATRPVAAAHLLEAVVEAKALAHLHRLRHLPRLRLPLRNLSRRRMAPALRRTATPSHAICFTTNTATSSLLPLRPATARPSIW